MLLREASFIAFSTQEFLNANELVTREKRTVFKKKLKYESYMQTNDSNSHFTMLTYLFIWTTDAMRNELVNRNFSTKRNWENIQIKEKKSSKWMQSKGTFPPLSPLSFFEDNTHRNIELLNFIRSEFTCVNFRNRIYLERKAELTLHLL